MKRWVSILCKLMNLNLADAVKKIRVLYTKKETKEDVIALSRVKPYVPTQQPEVKKTGRGPNRGDKKGRVAEVADMAIAITAIIGSDMSSKAKTEVRTVLHSCIGTTQLTDVPIVGCQCVGQRTKAKKT
jgi:hypothetical protein